MPKKVNVKELFKQYSKKVDFMEGYLNKYDEDLRLLQKQLLDLILIEYLPKFATKDGNIILNEKNALLMQELDNVFAKFKEQFSEATFKKTGEAMLKLVGLTSDYFKVQNIKSKTLSNIENKLKGMQFTVGIDSKGKVIKNSFVDKLASTEQTKSLVADFVMKSIEAQKPYTEFVSGFNDLIEGTEGVGGAMERYLGSYVHDSMYAHSQAIDNFFGEELGLNRAYYAGDKIKSSRPFCVGGYDDKCGCEFEPKYGKIFTRDEIASWNGLDWRGKIPGQDVFSQRGGYNCRHNFMWVGDDITQDAMVENDENI